MYNHHQLDPNPYKKYHQLMCLYEFTLSLPLLNIEEPNSQKKNSHFSHRGGGISENIGVHGKK